MHYFIYPTKDAWISSGSNRATTGISEKDQNFNEQKNDLIYDLYQGIFHIFLWSFY